MALKVKTRDIVTNIIALAKVESVTSTEVVLKVPSVTAKEGYRFVKISKDQTDKLGIDFELFVNSSLVHVTPHEEPTYSFPPELKKLYKKEK